MKSIFSFFNQFALISLTTLALAACSGTSAVGSFLSPYKIEVVQGNVVTKEQTERLRAGMTRENVAEILGTPLLVSVFHSDRWDYVFTLRRQGIQPQQRKLSVYFEQDRLIRVAGDVMPSSQEFIDSISQGRR